MEVIVERTKTKSQNTNRPPKLASYTDEVWKENLNTFFKDFMELCWPEIYEQIDWSKEITFLEQELHNLLQHGIKGKRVADKLIRVHQKNGSISIVLLHLEIQKKGYLTLNQRTYIYNYRIFDKFNHEFPVVSLGVIIDSKEILHPICYERVLWGCRLRFEFPILNIANFASQKEKLYQSNNPFAMVILSQLMALETNFDPENRMGIKLKLIRLLLKKKWHREKIRTLLKCLDGLLALPEEFDQLFFEEVRKIEEETDMSFMTSFERYGYKKGKKDGVQEGIQLEQKRNLKIKQDGIQQGESSMLMRLLKIKFKNIPQKYALKIREADSEILMVWASRVLNAKSLEEVFK